LKTSGLLLLLLWALTTPMRAQLAMNTSTSFRIVNSNSGLSLAIAGDAQLAGTTAVQDTDAALQSTRWQFVPEGNNTYLIENLYTGQVLGISLASTAPGALALDWADNGTPDHLWQVLDAGNGQYKIRNVNSGLLLGISGASTAPGAPALQWVDNGTPDHLWTLQPAGAAYPGPLPAKIEYSSTDTAGIHDPSMIRTFWGYALFSTHSAIHEHVSLDRVHFFDAGTALPAVPAWTADETLGSGDLWAPDVSWRNGKFWLYYAASSFGSANSAIGLATSWTALPGQWKDSGAPVLTSEQCPGANAIDPAIVVDDSGVPWMSFGSFYGGIYLIQLDKTTGQVAAGATCEHLANRIGNADAIEGSYIYHHGGYYYLFVSLDFCCQGSNSTYHIGVGRSVNVNGPYYDRGGLRMDQGGVTLLRTSQGRYIGPGGQTVMEDMRGPLLVYHYYDGENNGLPTLGMNELGWTSDGWPFIRSKTVAQQH
jgi:arabinan endo-1,5-alpha-L-arabinosidase